MRARTLVVMGTADPDFDGFVGGPAGEARVVADRLHGQVLMVDGAGHYPHVEMPAQVNPAIVRFVGGRESYMLPCCSCRTERPLSRPLSLWERVG